jgi:haloalkane dehalogenase
MDILRTPDERFELLADYPFAPNYSDVRAGDGTLLRLHYVDEGPRDGQIMVCVHCQPAWSYLYRKMIPILTAAGYRVLAPDLIGFGRSDKPVRREDYTYSAHVDWFSQWFEAVGATGATFVGQDWGGLIGLRVLARYPDRFARIVVANTGLPDSRLIPDAASQMLGQMYPSVPIPYADDVRAAFQNGGPGAFLYWVKYAAECPDFSVRDVFGLLAGITDDAILAGYTAPFPDDRYIAGARQFPSLVPLLPHHADERRANDAAWAVLENWEKPLLTAFTDDDPVTRGGEAAFQARVPGAKARAHSTLKGGHFLQETQPKAFADAIIGFIRETT